MAFYHGKTLKIFTPAAGAVRYGEYRLEPLQQAQQQAHLKRLRALGCHPNPDVFSDPTDFCRRVLSADLPSILAAAVREDDSTTEFVSAYVPGRVPLGLRPHSGFEDRKEQLEQLASCLEPDALVPVLGAPGTGKTAFIAEALAETGTTQQLKSSSRAAGILSVLYLDLKRAWGTAPVLQRLTRALDMPGGSMPDEDDDGATLSEVRARLLYENLPYHFRFSIPLVIIDSLDQIAGKPEALEDAKALLGLDLLRHGAAIVASSTGGAVRLLESADRAMSVPVEIGALNAVAAEAVLSRVIGQRELAGDAIRILVHDAEELLSPRALRVGGKNFLLSTRRSNGLRTPKHLADCVLTAAANDVLKELDDAGCPMALSETVTDRQTPIIGLAVLGTLPVTRDRLSRGGQSLDYFSTLSSMGWLEEVEHGYVLPEMAIPVLRRELYRHPNRGAKIALDRVASCVAALIAVASDDLGTSECELVRDALEEARAWLVSADVPSDDPVRVVIDTALLPLAANDAVAPLKDAELSAFQRDTAATRGWAAAVATLVAAARPNGTVPELRAAWWQLISEGEAAPMVPSYHIRSIDSLICRVAMRRGLDKEILEGRMRLLPRLEREWRERGQADPALSVIIGHWAVNTARLQLGFGNAREAKELANRARTLVATAVDPADWSSMLYLRRLQARMARLDADLAPDPHERARLLESAVEAEEQILRLSAPRFPDVRSYIRTVGRVFEVTGAVAERDQWVKRVRNVLENLFASEFIQWPVLAQTTFVALLRDEADYAVDAQDRVTRLHLVRRDARRVEDSARKLAKAGDNRSLLVLGRVYRQLAKAFFDVGLREPALEAIERGKALAEYALKFNPTRAAWHFRLSLIEVMTKDARSRSSFDVEADEVLLSAKEDMINTVGRCRAWLEAQSDRGSANGNLELACNQLLWRMQGSVLRKAAADVKQAGGEFSTMPAAAKIERIQAIAAERTRIASGIERKYGKFVRLALAEIRNIEQLETSRAIIRRDGRVDPGRIGDLFAAAYREFPDAVLLAVEQARFARRIWDYPSAIAQFETLLPRIHDRALSQEVSLDLVETLLSAAVYNETVILKDGTECKRAMMLDRASNVLSTVFPSASISREAASLRDLVDLELGRSIDWAAAEKAFEPIVGGPEQYIHSVSANVTELRAFKTETIDHVATAVRNDFTHTEALRELGRLFLRRAELGRSEDPVVDAARAYGCFDACRVLELRHLDRETATTDFELARAIILAVRATRLPTPFPARPEDAGYASLMIVAAAKLDSARDRSVGAFHQAVVRTINELKTLRAALKSSAGESDKSH